MFITFVWLYFMIPTLIITFMLVSAGRGDVSCRTADSVVAFQLAEAFVGPKEIKELAYVGTPAASKSVQLLDIGRSAPTRRGAPGRTPARQGLVHQQRRHLEGKPGYGQF